MLDGVELGAAEETEKISNETANENKGEKCKKADTDLPPRLKRENGVYTYRRKIPIDIAAMLSIHETKISCRTTNLRAAMKLYAAFESRFDELYTDLRIMQPSKSKAIDMYRAALGGRSHDKTIQEAARAYAEKEGTGWDAKGVNEFNKAVNDAIAVLGENPIRFIDGPLVTAWRNQMLSDGAKKGTVNKKLARLSAVFKYAVGEGWIITNPFKGQSLKINNKEKRDSSHKDFEDTDLRYIFEHVLQHPGTEGYKSYMYWLPLLAFFTGARTGDLCDLRKEDIKTADAVPHILIGNNKTDGDIREVPIHSKLIELGFCEWIDSLKKGEKLFTVTSRLDGNYDYKWWRKNTSFDHVNKTFHSFRGTIKTRLNNLGVSTIYSNDITGHSRGKNVGDSEIYTKRTKLVVLKEALEKLDVSFIDWEKVEVNATTTTHTDNNQYILTDKTDKYQYALT